MFFLDNLLVLVFLCFNFFYAMIVLGKKIIFSLQPYIQSDNLVAAGLFKAESR